MPLYGESKKDFKYINKYHTRVDAKDKVTGRARYTADMKFHRMLHGGTLFSPYVHAKVISIDTSEAEKMPGVVAIITCFDKEAVKKSWGYYYYLTDHICFEADTPAIVACEKKEQVKPALEAIKVVYEELPAVFTVDEALAPGAPLVHPEEGAACAGNIWHQSRKVSMKGDVEEAFKHCDLVLEREYETFPVEHAYLEPEVAIAVPNGGHGEMEVHSGCVDPYFCRRWVADTSGLPRARNHVIQETIGGSFGGKEELNGLNVGRAVLLAKKTGRPVKMVCSREESFKGSTKRHPFKLKYKVGVNKDGTLQAVKTMMYENIGAYHMHEFMNFRASVHAPGVYNIPNVYSEVVGVFTNTVTAGAMRGYSSPQLIYGQEQLYEEVAEAIGMDYLEFKKKNMLKTGDTSPCGQYMDAEIILPEMVDRVCEATDFNAKREAYKNQTGTKRKGIGISIFYRGAGLGEESPDATAGYVCVHDDGSVMINHGICEQGQGMNTCFTQIVAETLSVPVENIFFVGVDTNTIPDSGITAASRATVMGAHSIKKAAQEVRDNLLKTAAMMFSSPAPGAPEPEEPLPQVTPEMCTLEDGFFKIIGVPDAMIPWQAVCNVHHWTGGQCGSLVWHRPADQGFDHRRGYGKAFPTYSYGVVVAEVEVDYETGDIKVEKVTSGHDLGTVINPVLAKGQIYGGIAMGQGFATMEDLAIKDGHIRNANLDTYMIPSTLDVPKMEAMLFECNDPAGTYGAKSLGEPATEGVAAAIVSAMHCATGKRITTLPMNKVKMYDLLHEEQ